MLAIQQSLESRLALLSMMKTIVMAGLKCARNCPKSRPDKSVTLRVYLLLHLWRWHVVGSQRDLHFTCTVLLAFCLPLVPGTTCDKLMQIAHLIVVYFFLKKFHFMGLVKYRKHLSPIAGKYIAALHKRVGRSGLVWLALECGAACLMCYE